MSPSLSQRKKKGQEIDHDNFNYVHRILIKRLYELTQVRAYKVKYVLCGKKGKVKILQSEFFKEGLVKNRKDVKYPSTVHIKEGSC